MSAALAPPALPGELSVYTEALPTFISEAREPVARGKPAQGWPTRSACHDLGCILIRVEAGFSILGNREVAPIFGVSSLGLVAAEPPPAAARLALSTEGDRS